MTYTWLSTTASLAEDHLCQEHDWIGTQALRQGCHTDGRAVGIGVIGVDLFGQT
jgi:hypothetical protein